MIRLEMMYDEVPEKREINGVVFTDGVVDLPDSLKVKAESICKFYNVEMTIISDLGPVGLVDEIEIEIKGEDEDEDE